MYFSCNLKIFFWHVVMIDGIGGLVGVGGATILYRPPILIPTSRRHPSLPRSLAYGFLSSLFFVLLNCSAFFFRSAAVLPASATMDTRVLLLKPAAPGHPRVFLTVVSLLGFLP